MGWFCGTCPRPSSHTSSWHTIHTQPKPGDFFFFFCIENPFFKTKVQTKFMKSCCCMDVAQALLHAYSPCLCSAKVTASSLRSSCKCSALAEGVYTPLALWGKVSFGIHSLSHKGYAADQLGCSSSALNFNKPLYSGAQQPGVPKPCWAVDTNQPSPPATWEESDGVGWKGGQPAEGFEACQA